MPRYNWTIYHDTLYELYILQNKTFKEVQEIMKEQNYFNPRYVFIALNNY